MTKREKIMNDALSLTDEQKVAFEELRKAIIKCRDAGMAILPIDETLYAVNWANVYDVDPNYNDWTVYSVDIRGQQKLPGMVVFDKVRTTMIDEKINIAFSEDVASELFEV